MTAVNASEHPIGMTLKLERTAARVSLTQVANAIGVSVGHLSHIEAGRRNASPEMVERIRVAVRASRRAA